MMDGTRMDSYPGRFQLPIMPTNINSDTMTCLSPAPRANPPQSAARGSIAESIASVDRLSLRLKSNSGLSLRTSEASFKQYTDYGSYGTPRGQSFGASGRSSRLSDRLPSTYGEMPDLSPRSAMFSPKVFDPCPDHVDILSKDIFTMMLENQSICQYFFNYCEDQGCEENMEFLMRIKDFTQSTDEVAAVLAAISTSFTSLGAAKPINLPPLVNRSLNTDLRRIARSVLPSVERVFLEAKACVEERTARDVFPGFVKSQFAYCTATALAGSSHSLPSAKLEFPGLGESFCLVDAMDFDHTIIAASDAFSRMTGYGVNEMISKSCGFLQGPATDQMVVARIRAAVANEEETVELLLNYKKDGEAFWNLLFLMPLRDNLGHLRFWLGAQINVSETISARKDVLRVLNFGQHTYADSGVSFGSPTSPHTTPSIMEESKFKRSSSRGGDGDSILRERNGGPEITKRKSHSQFMSSFRKSSAVSSPTKTGQNAYDFIINQSANRPPRPAQYSAQKYKLSGGISVFPTAYSYYLVLSSGAPLSHKNIAIPRMPATPTKRDKTADKKQTMKLPVVFYSDAAVELLNLRSDVYQTGVFEVLAEHSGSPSITKSFKSSVRERVSFGKTTNMEILIDKPRASPAFTTSTASVNGNGAVGAANGGAGGDGCGSNNNNNNNSNSRGGGGLGRRGTVVGTGGGRPPTADRENGTASRTTTNDALDRLERRLNKSFRQDKVMTHWCPLHEGSGMPQWIVVIFTPL